MTSTDKAREPFDWARTDATQYRFVEPTRVAPWDDARWVHWSQDIVEVDQKRHFRDGRTVASCTSWEAARAAMRLLTIDPTVGIYDRFLSKE